MGNAVTRNKIKRWCRELIRRSHIECIGAGVDINIVFFAQEGDFYKNLEFSEFSQAISDGWQKLIKQVERSY